VTTEATRRVWTDGGRERRDRVVEIRRRVFCEGFSADLAASWQQAAVLRSEIHGRGSAEASFDFMVIDSAMVSTDAYVWFARIGSIGPSPSVGFGAHVMQDGVTEYLALFSTGGPGDQVRQSFLFDPGAWTRVTLSSASRTREAARSGRLRPCRLKEEVRVSQRRTRTAESGSSRKDRQERRVDRLARSSRERVRRSSSELREREWYGLVRCTRHAHDL